MNRTLTAAAGLLAAASAHATILTFSNFAPSSTTPVPDDYGDRVDAVFDPVTGYEYEMGNGFTPNVEVEYEPDVGDSFEVWNGYADLQAAMGDNQFRVPGEVVFTADPGLEVVLNGFDLAPWTSGQPDADVSVTDGGGQVLFSRTYSTGGVEVTTHVSFPGGLRAPVLRLRVNDFGDWAIDNVDFDQSDGGCNAADIAEPFGLLDLADVSAFIGAFTAQQPPADLDGNGLYDLADVNMFVSAFLAGCP